MERSYKQKAKAIHEAIDEIRSHKVLTNPEFTEICVRHEVDEAYVRKVADLPKKRNKTILDEDVVSNYKDED